MVPNQREVSNIIGSLDIQSRWMEKNVRISHPFIGDGQNTEQTDQFASTRVGDETDTSPFDDTSDQLYISTGEYIRKMKLLINYLVSLN
jgi:hypothetical protein